MDLFTIALSIFFILVAIASIGGIISENISAYKEKKLARKNK